MYTRHTMPKKLNVIRSSTILHCNTETHTKWAYMFLFSLRRETSPAFSCSIGRAQTYREEHPTTAHSPLACLRWRMLCACSAYLVCDVLYRYNVATRLPQAQCVAHLTIVRL